MDNQRPTVSYILPYEKTEGIEAIRIYNKSKRTAIEWQELLVNDILSVDENGLWNHSKFGYSVPRRNGKSEISTAIILYGIKKQLKVLYTAHRTTTSNVMWQRTTDILNELGFEEKRDFFTGKKFGLEDIRMGNAKVNYRTRSTKGGLGEGYDILIIDEAQEYTDDQETALKYVVSDSPNPLTVMCGTPPTPLSSGTVFTKYREATLKGEREHSGWAEWSVPQMSDVKNKDFWYQANPSLGVILTERAITDEIGSDEVDFNIQRLGLWLQYNLQSEISEIEWMRLAVDRIRTSDFKGKLFVGVKYGADGTNVALSVAVKTKDNHVFIECIGCRSVREGNDWIIAFLKNIDYAEVCVDGASGQKILEAEMKDAGLKRLIMPTVKEVIHSNAMFEKNLYSQTLKHKAQQGLLNSVTNCEKRAIGTAGGFGFKTINENYDIAIMDSMVLAQWRCSIAKEHKKQKISY